jgi:hypothetical protein
MAQTYMDMFPKFVPDKNAKIDVAEQEEFYLKIFEGNKRNNKMDINLKKATIEDANEIHQMQLKSFKELLDKYQDYEISPGNEPIDKIIARIYIRYDGVIIWGGK